MTNNSLPVVLCVLIFATARLAAAGSPETVFSLSGPASVPGAVLSAGQYRMAILDRLPDRYILEIRGSEKDNPLAVFLAIPDEKLPRLKTGMPVFWPNSGPAPAIRGMWVSGAPTGATFVFPKAEAAKLAQQVGQPVAAIDPESEGRKDVVNMPDTDRRIVTLWLLSAVAVTPEGKQAGIQAAKFVPSEPIRSAMAATEPVSGLPELVMPKTAGSFAGNLLAGLLFLAGGLTMMTKSNGRSRSNSRS